MTERGLPIVGGAPACPFVAFEDDRDERATSPDHRHRCYAEAHPAPRALAHQEAYCLSSAFPVCPTFQDWARREAARARPPDLPPVEAEEDADLPPLVSDRPPRRDSRGQWSAPPPWLRSTAGQAGLPQSPIGPGADDRVEAPAADEAARGSAAVGGLSGSFADRLATDRGPGGSESRDDAPARGAPGPDERPVVEEAADEDEAFAIARPRRRERFAAGHEPDEAAREQDVWAPSWERPRRLEAYPTLRSRRLPSAVVPPLLLGLVALVLAAAALFFLPSLLGIGGPPAGSSAPSASTAALPSGSPEPSAEPVATPFLYTVKEKDTLSKIATRFGVPLQAILDANPEIKDADKISVGQEIVIPIATPTEIPGTSAEASP